MLQKRWPAGRLGSEPGSFYWVLLGFTGFYWISVSSGNRPVDCVAGGSGCGFRVQLCAFLEPHCTSLNASFGRRGWAGPSERNSELPRPSHRLRQMATGRRVRECVEVRPTRSVNLQSRTQGTSFSGRKCRCVGADWGVKSAPNVELYEAKEYQTV